VITPSIEAFPIRKLLSGLENEFSIIAEEKNLRFRVVSSDDWVLSDQNLLHSILQNFLSNAIRYTLEGSVMMICRPDECGLRIEVRDSGIGIDSAHLDVVFQEFHQLHENATEGLGLGLAITRRIANLLSHKVGVRSRVGSGSVFFVRLPVVAVDRREVSNLSPEPAEAHFLNGCSVLCMDDEPAILEATQALLERWGAQVTAVKRVKEFDQLRQAQTHFDVFIADYHLRDELMGLDLLKTYRDQADGDFLGILMTAERDPTIEDQALMEGFDFIEKPVDPNRLREVLIAHLAEHRMTGKQDSQTVVQ
jgi:CheY-like chemotaxis protein/anti-sigma regulatory factor (Ser/Thr protein kinase)